ncbi:MAG: hypothetical protein ACKV2Q_21300 [Planctomycetaceae bacterium]
MRNQPLLVGALSVSLCVGAWQAIAQETQPMNSAKSNDAGNPIDSTTLPAVPLTIISRATWSGPEADRLGLTKKQREDLSAFVTAHYQQTSRIQRVQTELDHSGLKNHRFQLAITELVDDLNAKAQTKVQTLFTAEQLAKLRQAHRQEIQQASFVTRRNSPQPSTIGMPSLDTVLANHDLLSILELSEIQQALSVTDEQWQRIEAAKKAGHLAARPMILKAADVVFPGDPTVDTSLTKLIEQFGKDTLQQLSEEQRTQYQTLVQERQKKLAAITANPAANTHANSPAEMIARFQPFFSHGTPTQMQSQATGAESTFKVTLHNAFAIPEVQNKLQLTESQQQEIAKQLAEFQPIVVKHLQEQHRKTFQAETVRRERLRELVLAHNAESEKQLADLLTADQQARLKQECWKSLGLSSLLRTEIAEQLQLTGEQSAFIRTQLQKPSPTMPNFGAPGTPFEVFKKQSEDFHRKMLEHHTAINSAVWENLTPEQREKFEKLTGLKPPRK